MFQKVILFFIILILAVIQSSIFPNFFPSGTSPNLVLILIIFFSMKSGFNENWGKVVFSGLVLDLISGSTIGVNIISLASVAFFMSSVAKRFLVSQKGWGFFVRLGSVVFGTLLNGIIIAILLKFFGAANNSLPEKFPIAYFSFSLVLAIISNVCFFFLALWPMAKLDRFLDFYRRDRFTKTRFLK